MSDEAPPPPKDAVTPPAPVPPALLPVAEEKPAEDWESRFKYLLADFENFRKRTAREQATQRDRTRAELLRALLPIHEAFEKARESFAGRRHDDPHRQGLDLLAKEWAAFLAAEGVRPLAAPGAAFRPDDHEAVAETVVGPKHPEGSIVEVVQQGYRFRGGLLRPAKVVVARKPPPTVTPAEPTATSTAEAPTADPKE